MPRRHRRRRIAWEGILGVLFVANLVTGLYASRLTSLIKIRVEGAMPDDMSRIRTILERTHSRPALQLDRRATESAIQARVEVDSVQMSRNIFGRARVLVAYRIPVAAIQGSPNRALSIDGVMFETSRDLSGLPRVSLPESSRIPVVGVVGPWRFRDIASLASNVNGIAGKESLWIQATDDGGLCLNIGSKFAVDLGLPDGLDAKVDKLKERLETEPDLLTSGKTLNLVSPVRASIREGVGRNTK